MESSGSRRDTAWAMSEENVELVRQAYEAWNEDGPESIARFWAEDAELHDPPTLPDRRVVRGRDAVVAHLADQVKVVGAMRLTPVEVRTRGDAVVLRMEVTMHGVESGLDIPGEIAQVLEVADGRIQGLRNFMTWEEALEAAGRRD